LGFPGAVRPLGNAGSMPDLLLRLLCSAA